MAIIASKNVSKGRAAALVMAIVIAFAWEVMLVGF